MSKVPVEKKNFYPELIEMVDQAQESVYFYTISCCFGFYSSGLSNFEKVLTSIRDRLSKKISGRYLDVKVLVKIDHDNPVDIYAAERLAQLESRYAHTGGSDKDRNVFRELSSDSKDIEAVQFISIDHKTILVSAIQDETYNETLDLVLNTSKPGTKFDESDADKELRKYEALFQKTWDKSAQLDVDIKPVSRRKLRFFLEKYEGIKTAKNERDMQLLLTGYLQGLFDPSIVDLEAPIGDTRIDLLVGRRPTHRKYGVELKFRPNDGAIHGIVGQIRKYSGEFENLLLVVGQPKYSAKQRLHLISELKEIDVGLIELK